MSPRSYDSQKGGSAPQPQTSSQFETRPFGISAPFEQPAPPGQFEAWGFEPPAYYQTPQSPGQALQTKEERSGSVGFELANIPVVAPQAALPAQAETTTLQRSIAHEFTHVVQREGDTVLRRLQEKGTGPIGMFMSNTGKVLLQMTKSGKKKGGALGGLSGALLGSALGAAIGSVFPGIGTLIGAGIGGGLGLLVGALAGTKIGDDLTGTEEEANREELGEATTDKMREEQAAWENAASGNRLFVHGVTDYDIPELKDRGATPERKAQMEEKLRNPAVLQELFVSTSLIDSVEHVITDWTGSGLVLNIPKENIYAAASTDLAIKNKAIQEPGELVPEIERIRGTGETASKARVERAAQEMAIKMDRENATQEEIDQEVAAIRAKARGGLPTPDEIISDTGVGKHNEVAALGKAPTGEVITGAGYFYLISYDGKPIEQGPLFTRPERKQLLEDLAWIKGLPLYSIRANVGTDGVKIINPNDPRMAKVGEVCRIDLSAQRSA